MTQHAKQLRNTHALVQEEEAHNTNVAAYQEKLRDALRQQAPDLLAHYDNLPLPSINGRIAYLGAGHDFVTPWILDSKRRFKMIDTYSAEAAHHLIDTTPLTTKIVVAHDSAKLEAIVARNADCACAVLYHQDRKEDYVTTTGKPFMDRATFLITDDQPSGYTLVGEIPAHPLILRHCNVPVYGKKREQQICLPWIFVYQKASTTAPLLFV